MAGHIFISYSRRDRPYVERLADYLTASDLPVWFDHELIAGDRFGTAIKRKIRECLAFLPILTPESVRSDWVNIEIEYAYKLRKPILPLVLRPCDDEPIVLVRLHHEDVSGDVRLMPSVSFVQRLQALQASMPTRDDVAPPRPFAAVTDTFTRLTDSIWGGRRTGLAAFYRYAAGLSILAVALLVAQLIFVRPFPDSAGRFWALVAWSCLPSVGLGCWLGYRRWRRVHPKLVPVPTRLQRDLSRDVAPPSYPPGYPDRGAPWVKAAAQQAQEDRLRSWIGQTFRSDMTAWVLVGLAIFVFNVLADSSGTEVDYTNPVVGIAGLVVIWLNLKALLTGLAASVYALMLGRPGYLVKSLLATFLSPIGVILLAFAWQAATGA